MKSNEYANESSKDTLPPTKYGSVDERKDLYGEPGGRVTSFVEEQTGKMPWVSFVGLSVISMAASAAIVAARRKEERDFGSFVGLWAPCFMLLGVYNKLVHIDRKLTGHLLEMPKPHADIPSSTAYLS